MQSGLEQVATPLFALTVAWPALRLVHLGARCQQVGLFV